MLLKLFLILFVAIAMGTFAGLLVSANTPFGSFSFTDPRKDAIRSLIVGLVTAGVCVGLLALTRNPRFIVALVPLWYITVKLCWLEMEMVDFFVLALTSLAFLSVAALFARKLLGS
jgi:hypothetical protein